MQSMHISPPTARRLCALLTATAGLINILSALSPAIPGRMEVLEDILPIHLIRGTQTATVLAGFFLILLADGLRKRRRRAMQVAVALLVASTFLNIVKGLDVEEAVAAVLIAAGLIARRDAFTVPSRLPGPSRMVSHVA